jgi:hypothetical protein
MQAGIKDYYKSNKHTNKKNKKTNTNKLEQSVSKLHKPTQRKGNILGGFSPGTWGATHHWLPKFDVVVVNGK